MDLALNDLQKLIGHKTQPTNQPTKNPFNLKWQLTFNEIGIVLFSLEI